MANKKRFKGLLLTVVAVTCGCLTGTPAELTMQELDEIRDASRAYTEAWLSNDPEAVMSTFVADPVLAPSGLPFLEGQAAARSFWWPEGGPLTTVTRFETDEIEVAGSGNLGYARGTFVLEFEYGGNVHTNRGKYLHLVERVNGTGWRISHHFWNDLPSQ